MRPVAVTFPGDKFTVEAIDHGQVRVRQWRRALADQYGAYRCDVLKVVREETFEEPLHVVLDRVHEIATDVRRGRLQQGA